MYNFLAKLIFIIIVSIIYFFIKDELSILDIYSYIAILLAYFLFITVPYLTKGKLNKTIKDLPLYQISFIYLIVEIIIAIYTANIGFDFEKNYILVQCILTGLYLILFFIFLDINVKTSEHIEEQEIDMSFITNIKKSLNNILIYTSNSNDRKCIQDLIDLVQASPIKSKKEKYHIENMIIDKINAIETQIKNDKSINFEEVMIIQKLLSERNNNQ